MKLAGFLLAVVSLCAVHAVAQVPSDNAPRSPARVERLGRDSLRVGNVYIDVARKEISAKGVITNAIVLEFIAVAKGGFKAYESAIELDTSGVDFNLALILIGLDASHAVVPRMHFDPILPQGDPVEIWVEWEDGGARRKVRAEQLVYNTQTKKTLSEGPWVYTGSVFSAENKAYLADLEGTLIGFVHTPAPVIESPRDMLPGEYADNKLNPDLNLKPGTSVTLSVRALAR